MPLLTSPIDGSPMKQIQRFGIELDVCPTSGGVWLDKGELEKIIALIKEASNEEAATFKNESKQPLDYKYKGKHKKKGAIHHMMELFDF
jgi:Zn-finger nucleic acid-binding protein